MPFIETPEPQPQDIGTRPFETPVVRDDEEISPSVLEGLSAGFQLENITSSAYSASRYSTETATRRDEDYDVFDDIEGYEQYSDRFASSFNREKTSAIKADIDRELRLRRIRDASGWAGFAGSLGGAVFDLPSFIPSVAFVRSGKLGFSAGRSALAVAGASGGAATLAEVALQATQQTRPLTESAAAIGGSVVLGGLLGYGGARLLNRGEWDRLSKSISAELSGAEGISDIEGVTQEIIGTLQAGGAEAVEKLNLEDLGITGAAADKVAKLTSALKLNPGVQSMLSPSAATRRIFAELAETPVARKMEDVGKSVGAAVETELKLIERGAYSQAKRANIRLYREMRKSGVKMTRREFNEAVGRAGRTADTDAGGNEFVTRAAREWRSELFDKVKDEGIAIKAWPEDIAPTTAASYLTRMYKFDALISRELDFKRIISSWAREQIEAMPQAKLDEMNFVSKSDMESYVDDVAESVFRNLTRRSEGEDQIPDWIVPLKRGPLKERVLKIDDEKIIDFLEDDIELVGRYYARTAGAEIALKRRFGRADMKDQLAEIRNEYTGLRKAAKADDKELRRLNAAEKRDVGNVRAFRDLIRGTYNQGRDMTAWGKATRAALGWNYMRLLGGVTVSSIPDVMRTIGFRGIRPIMGELVPALANNIKGIKLSIKEAKQAGAVTEVLMNSRLATLAELTDPIAAAGSKFERLMDNATTQFSRLTGLSFWNDFQKGAVSILAQNRIIDNAINWKGLDKIERRWMANSGIDEVMAGKIAAQARKHGNKEKTIWVANSDAWDDPATVRAWRSAIVKAADVQIVTKGVSDAPLFLQTNAGRLIMQFKSFALASHQRVLLSGLQGRPRHMAEMMVSGTILGMMVAYFKNLEAGRTDDAQRLADNPGRWVAEGLDRSGIFSIPMEVSNTLEKFGGKGVVSGISALAGDEAGAGGPVSRYASRNATGTLIGPMAGLIEDLLKIAQQFGSGDVRESGVNAAFRQIPGRGLPGIRPAIEYGLKPKAKEALIE